MNYKKKKKPFLTSQSLLFLFISYSPFIQTMESIPSPVGERVLCYVSSSQKSLLLKAMISTSIFIRPFWDFFSVYFIWIVYRSIKSRWLIQFASFYFWKRHSVRKKTSKKRYSSLCMCFSPYIWSTDTQYKALYKEMDGNEPKKDVKKKRSNQQSKHSVLRERNNEILWILCVISLWPIRW